MRRRYYRRKARGRRGRKKNRTLTSKVNYLLRQNKQNRPELEFDDGVGVNLNIYTTPTIAKLGTSTGERKTLKSIQMNGEISYTGSTTQAEWYRIIIFTDKSNEGGTIPTWAEVFDGATGLDAVLSLRAVSQEQNEGQRFRIIWDRTFKLYNDTAQDVIDNKKIFRMYRKLNIPSINSSGYWEAGGLYLAYVGTTNTGAADFNYRSRIRNVERSTG